MKRNFIIFLNLTLLLAYGCASIEISTEQKIKEKLIDYKLVYYNIAGQPLNFTISAGDIKSIEKLEIKGEIFWKARVGDSLMWDIYLDRNGENVVKKEQLFVT